MTVSLTNAPTPFVYNCLVEKIFFPDAQHNIIWVDPYQHADNAEQEIPEQFRQCCYVIYEEIIALEAYAVYKVAAAFLELFNGEELIGLIRVLSSYRNNCNIMTSAFRKVFLQFATLKYLVIGHWMISFKICLPVKEWSVT